MQNRPYPRIIRYAVCNSGRRSVLQKTEGGAQPRGIVVCINEGIAKDHSSPWDMVLGYLTYNMQGMPFGVLKGQIESLAKKSGFSSVETRTMLLSTGTHDISIIR